MESNVVVGDNQHGPAHLLNADGGCMDRVVTEGPKVFRERGGQVLVDEETSHYLTARTWSFATAEAA